MTSEYRPISRRTLLTAALGGAAVGVVGQGLFAGAAGAAPKAGRQKLLIGSVDRLGNGVVQLTDPSLTGEQTLVPVNGQPNGIVGSPDGLRAYVGTVFGPGLSVVDVDGGRVTGEVAVGGFANELLVSPDGRTVYVATGSAGAGGSSGHVAVVDTASGEVRARIKAGLLPRSLALSPDGKQLFVGDERAKGVTIVDTAKNAVSGRFETDGTPLLIAIDPKGKNLYVAQSRELATFGLRGGKSGATALDGVPCGLAVHPNGTFAAVSLYAGRNSDSQLVTVNINSNKVRTKESNGKANGPLAMSKDGGRAFVLDEKNRKVTSADTNSGKPDSSLPTPNSNTPTSVAFVETA
ncbi:YncE family protein [Lentzea sp. HUAS12]|uniref:YncE family protein n=1 Tax=Lentzea sp. HUAS12 TaxID=2951806 RepID=UPI00209F73E8|nr:YncE family protein [Lentzea sp. HUAS12]USX49322.1 YncE family protein [Lentzea sp. HUAS12]